MQALNENELSKIIMSPV